MPPGRPPLDLHAEVTLADGSRYRWDSGAKGAGDRPQGISFRTKKGDGFADASLTLARRIDQDYVDLNLYDDFALVGYDGSVAYEGRMAANPRSLGEQSHQMSVVLQGWMAHAKDRKFTEIYVDRDLSQWRPPSFTRQAALLTGTAYRLEQTTTAADDSGTPALIQTLRLDGGMATESETWYDAGPGPLISAIYYDEVSPAGSNITTADANWQIFVRTAATDAAGSPTSSANLVPAVAGTGATGYYTPTSQQRYAWLQFVYNSSAAGTPGFDRRVAWRKVAVYGNHGLTRRNTDPGGFYASDVIANIVSRFCPKLNTAGVQSTTYAIPHLVFKDPTAPYDAILDVNKYHLWNLAVYENKTLFFEPFDYTDYDWEVRLSDPGVTVDLQGDSVDSFANGIAVNYDDVATGKPNRITPADDSTLADTSSMNPANTHGLTVWTETTLSAPTTAAAAAQHGRAVLAEFNQPKAPGTIRVTGHIRDRAGHWQQVWKVRAGDRIIISDHPNDRVRLVVETDYNHDSKTVSIAVDSSFMRVDAVQDRVVTALQAAGLM